MRWRRAGAGTLASVRRVGGEALVAWIATAGVGLSLLGIWIGHGGPRSVGPRRLTTHLLFTHIAPALVGLVLWIAFLVSDDASLAWMAFGMVVVVAAVGATNFFIWQQRRAGVLRATASRWDLTPGEAADQRIPAEQHFPVGTVVLHGTLAVTTLVLTLVAALQAGGGAETPAPAAARVVTGAAASVGPTSATVLGATGGVRGRARFEFGADVRGGGAVPASSAGGDAVTGALTGLQPATLYHYRLAVGARRGADRTFVTAPPPRLTLRGASLRPAGFGRGGRATLRFALNAPASVRVVVARVVRPPRRAPVFVRRATLVLDAPAGASAVAFGARPELARLRPGPYRATLVAALPHGRPSAPVRLAFTLLG
jgi:hypothetical protein